MPTIDDMLESNYIQKSDLKQPTRLTVAGVERKDVGQEGKPEVKWVVSFAGAYKPLILNVTNTKAFFATLGDNSDDWAGKQIILFNDMTVEYNGVFGGIRVYRQLEVADAPSQTADQFAQNQNIPRDDDSGPLPEEPPQF
ncbi:hypothetical protein LCGC14_0619270 [marine sediment metagenome]|uniref:Uncharacterized protein n=1 Tax=marine sediment metagenome TaxID=412755 RepID=A0A0F9R580_9ZZZZ